MSEAYEQVRRALAILRLAQEALRTPSGAGQAELNRAADTSYRFLETVNKMLHETLDILEEKQE